MHTSKGWGLSGGMVGGPTCTHVHVHACMHTHTHAVNLNYTCTDITNGHHHGYHVY